MGRRALYFSNLTLFPCFFPPVLFYIRASSTQRERGHKTESIGCIFFSSSDFFPFYPNIFIYAPSSIGLGALGYFNVQTIDTIRVYLRAHSKVLPVSRFIQLHLLRIFYRRCFCFSKVASLSLSSLSIEIMLSTLVSRFFFFFFSTRSHVSTFSLSSLSVRHIQ